MTVPVRRAQAELFCLCQQPYHADTAMVSCDACEEWFHLRCVGLSQAAAKSLRKYTCPVCASLRVRLFNLKPHG